MPKLETCIKGDGDGGDKCTQGFKSSFLFKLFQNQAFHYVRQSSAVTCSRKAEGDRQLLGSPSLPGFLSCSCQ